MARKTEPYMPRDRAKIPDPQIDIIAAWIRGGLLDKSTSKALAAKPRINLTVDADSLGKPDGPPPMPAQPLLMEPIVLTKRPNAIVALAHSPWAPLLAVAGHRQVLLYNSDNDQFLGVLPFPEGVAHSLQFTRNGKLLMAGGGQGAKVGLAALYDVATGQRVATVGEEYDEALAADITPDQSLVALGGPSKLIKAYATADGELKYSIKKHTDWVLALAYSPDGKVLASGDRNGAIHLWEADSGQPLYDLTGHRGAVNAIAWRADSKIIASASDDGAIRLWDPATGESTRNWTAHAGGALDVRFTADGRLVSAGRDKRAAVWNLEGKKLRDFEPFSDLAMSAVFNHEGKKVVVGGYLGEVRVFDAESGKKLADLSANPPSIDQQIEQLQARYSQLRADADKARSDQAAKQAQLKAAVDELARAQARQSQLLRDTDAASKLAADLEQKLKDPDKDIRQKARADQEQAKKNLAASRAELEKLNKAVPAISEKVTILKQESSAVAAIEQRIAEVQSAIARLQAAKPLAQSFRAREDLAVWKAEHARSLQLLAAAAEEAEKKKAQAAVDHAAAMLKETQALVDKLTPKKSAK
jgi:WD40 repeat protein